ncbi:MAG TPA: LD-carboxypeptidase [Casimicrobiaceae bacterium]|nr:LD-carboxypeptidase [Casimicrobiaceae bacterium]
MSASIRFGLVAPAGFTTDPASVDRAKQRLQGMGHSVIVDPTVDSRWTRFSAPDDERLAAIARMTERGDVDVAVMARGGYGFSRLLDRIDFAALARRRVRWMGHSDFTAFQLAALARAGIVTFGGPMACYDFGAEQPSAFTLDHCFGLLGNPAWEVECALEGASQVSASGVLWGGNLALVAHLVGTPYLPDVSGGVLFLEDVAEHPYRIERMLYQLYYAGILQRQRAILLGAFTEYQLTANDDGYDLAAVVAHFRERVTTPIFTGLPFGHVRDKLTLPVGGRCAISVREGAARLVLSDYRR